MIFKCQSEADNSLVRMKDTDIHSIIISGPGGSGKTFLANLHSKRIGADRFFKVEPSVGNFKELLASLLSLDGKIVVCVENLDLGNIAAAQVILKTLEEPTPDLYMIITCRNINMIPATIKSRGSLIFVNSPAPDDLVEYGNKIDASKVKLLSNSDIWRCVAAFDDINLLFNMSLDEQNYVTSVASILNKEDSISNIQWNLSHYPNNSESSVEFMIRYLMYNTKSTYVKKLCLWCLNSLSMNRVGVSAILSKFIMEYKYGS